MPCFWLSMKPWPFAGSQAWPAAHLTAFAADGVHDGFFGAAPAPASTSDWRIGANPRSRSRSTVSGMTSFSHRARSGVYCIFSVKQR